MTTSNKLTISRVILIVFILFFMLFPFGNTTITTYNNFLESGISITWNYIVALSLFIICAITDMLDGKLARKRNEVTNFGKLIDPIADKILINSIIIIFAINGWVPAWLALIFIIRDAFVDGLRLLGSTKGRVMSAKTLGKQKTIWQFIGIVFIFIVPATWTGINWWVMIPLYIATLFSLLSWFVYYKENWDILFEK